MKTQSRRFQATRHTQRLLNPGGARRAHKNRYRDVIFNRILIATLLAPLRSKPSQAHVNDGTVFRRQTTGFRLSSIAAVIAEWAMPGNGQISTSFNPLGEACHANREITDAVHFSQVLEGQIRILTLCYYIKPYGPVLNTSSQQISFSDYFLDSHVQRSSF